MKSAHISARDEPERAVGDLDVECKHDAGVETTRLADLLTLHLSLFVMSKYLKNLIADDLKKRLDGVSDLLVVDVMGMKSNKNVELRKQLRQKKINLLVVKNSLARRATEGTVLAPAFEGVEGSAAVVWGAEDIVSLAKEIIEAHRRQGSSSRSPPRAA